MVAILASLAPQLSLTGRKSYGQLPFFDAFKLHGFLHKRSTQCSNMLAMNDCINNVTSLLISFSKEQSFF